MLILFCTNIGIGFADDILEKGIAEFKAENYEEALSFFRQIK